MQWITGSLLAVALACQPALAQSRGDYPSQPIKIVVPFGAGSASDTVARVLSEELRPRFGTIVVDNKPGANGIIGASYVAKAAADGHTLVLTSSATHSGIGALYKQPGYDPIADFAHISRIATIPMVLVARPGAPFKSAKELAAQARKAPLRYGYGSGSAQIAAATFSTIADAPSDAIPYKSQPPAITDLLGGQIDYVLADASVVTSFLQGGRLGGLAITGARRLPELPAVPTMAEAGYKDFDLVVWVGLAAPAKTPAPIVAEWNQEIRRALQRPGVMAKLSRLGMVASPNTVDEHRAFTVAQRDVWVSRATKAGIEQQ
ncbi:tripartite tricarboxylate transporter substrate binding protein [Variovorax sp. J22P271]|uniref:Bug family tripartite tricarboxylate transporter substrate binding protein n=1 Tax=Variovorax davisae TaxID=3053515 RepID=UPI00257510B2|nr:tripartite tricarboxylate transporter substrate binding protein [Variovorax sp. J22P271]MDM0030812.1 tripartite tricarboxylate transporter substrate binding protein [Variovorax sp. J22P271]